MSVPDTLQLQDGAFPPLPGGWWSSGPELFQNPSWLAVHVGQLDGPSATTRWSTRAARSTPAAILAGLRRVIAEAAEAMPTHEAYIDRHCKAPPLR